MRRAQTRPHRLNFAVAAPSQADAVALNDLIRTCRGLLTAVRDGKRASNFQVLHHALGAYKESLLASLAGRKG